MRPRHVQALTIVFLSAVIYWLHSGVQKEHWLLHRITTSHGKGGCLRDVTFSLGQETLSKEQNVIAMSLFGGNPRYYEGAIRNSELVKDIFPDWSLRFYVPDKMAPLQLQVRFTMATFFFES